MSVDVDIDIDIDHALAVLARGGVVAIPTETVYGLAADAMNQAAIRRVFAIKQRPADHPLIVHLATADWLEDWAAAVPPAALRLADAFWPGPLTLVLPRHRQVLPAITGGQDSVALRVPDHPLTLALIRRLGRGVVAPSANRFTRLSPTHATHVREELGAAVDFILDGGPCRRGIESTILDLRSGAPRMLRPGALAVEDIEAVLRQPVAAANETLRAPGQHALHYSPQATVFIVAPGDMGSLALKLTREGRRVGVLAPPDLPEEDALRQAKIALVCVPAAPEQYAASLYQLLRSLDQQGCDVILASLPSGPGLCTALRDRLLRAAGQGSLDAPDRT